MVTDVASSLASPADETQRENSGDAGKTKCFTSGIINHQQRKGATPVAIYLSMHIIACMTRQALNQLITTMQVAQEIRFIRACASQMAGRLLCEFEAPDQDTLLRFLDKHHITHDWIIRAELTWGEQPAASPPTAEASHGAESGVSLSEPESVPQSQAPVAPETITDPPPTALQTSSRVEHGELREATILHILRRLKDESAWQMINTQHDMQRVAVLLMHDAVLVPPPLDVPMYACEADVAARGIASPLPRLTYDQIVDLIFACQRVMVW
jgi:sulfur transfer complex TusBCD TusB component (DsrH family)